MNIRTALIMISAVAAAYPALANGPDMDSAPTNQISPERQRWIEHRRRQIAENQEKYENEKFRYKLLLNPLGGQPSDVVEIAKFKMYEAETAPQRRRERVEDLMLKRETGQITPAENAALNKWLRQHTHRKSQ
jgi:threonyl-tRNA synthetase